MFRQKFLISALVLGWCAIPASATLVPYTTSSAFLAATTDTFQNITVTSGYLGTSFTDLGVDFIQSNGMTGVSGIQGFTGVAITTAFGGAQTITITFPSGVNAIEFLADGQAQNSQVYVFAQDGSGTINPELLQTGSSPLFFGVTTTDSTFTSFSIVNETPGDVLAIGDISIGEAQTPEVATLLLVATGLFLMSWMGRRKRGAAQAARRGTVRTMSTGITPA